MHETTVEQKESRSPEAHADIVILFILMIHIFLIKMLILFLTNLNLLKKCEKESINHQRADIITQRMMIK